MLLLPDEREYLHRNIVIRSRSVTYTYSPLNVTVVRFFIHLPRVSIHLGVLDDGVQQQC